MYVQLCFKIHILYHIECVILDQNFEKKRGEAFEQLYTDAVIYIVHHYPSFANLNLLIKHRCKYFLCSTTVHRHDHNKQHISELEIQPLLSCLLKCSPIPHWKTQLDYRKTYRETHMLLF